MSDYAEAQRFRDLQLGAAYLAHRARCDDRFKAGVAARIEGFEQASQCFLNVAIYALEALAQVTETPVEVLAERIAVNAAAAAEALTTG